MVNHQIHYSQCWEDPALLYKSLMINKQDIVLSITSGGDNSLALLLKQPQKIISIDLNPAQHAILALKIAALQTFSHDVLLEFIGVKPSTRRNNLYKQISNQLPIKTQTWWNVHKSAIRLGIIHSGRFEKFIGVFQHLVLPMIHSKQVIQAFLNIHSLKEQRIFYDQTWNSQRWRWLFSIFASRFILSRFARQPGMFAHTASGSVAKRYLERIQHNLTTIPIRNNYFMHYCLTTTYGHALPPYLEQQNYHLLQSSLPKLVNIIGNLTEYLQSMPDNSFSKFNLSDIFEALSTRQNDILWQEIIRTAKNGARVVYWNNLVVRSYTPLVAANIKDEANLATTLHAIDRAFFYNNFHVHTILK